MYNWNGPVTRWPGESYNTGGICPSTRHILALAQFNLFPPLIVYLWLYKPLYALLPSLGGWFYHRLPPVTAIWFIHALSPQFCNTDHCLHSELCTYPRVTGWCNPMPSNQVTDVRHHSWYVACDNFFLLFHIKSFPSDDFIEWFCVTAFTYPSPVYSEMVIWILFWSQL